jgi:broad specificity phosphatase PhoE
MTDPRVMPREERKILIEKLDERDPQTNYPATLEEEQIDPYETTVKRLKAFTDMRFAKRLEEQILKFGK